jgi:hypothetical protein
MEEEFEKEFKVHMLTDEGKEKAKQIARTFNRCLKDLREITGTVEKQTRYMSLVATKLEEACFFAKKEMAEKNCI